MAVDLRSRRFGFFVIEGATRVLDSGVRACKPGQVPGAHSFTAKAAKLMDRYCPHRVLIRTRRSQPGSVSAIGEIREQARKRSIPLSLISTKTVHVFFAQRGCRTRHEVASLLAGWFEDLAWKLPPKRRAWENERHNSIIFDAVASAVAFLAAHLPSPVDGPSADE